MNDEVELRRLLEDTQARLKRAEAQAEDLDRRRHVAEQRNHALVQQLESARAEVKHLEAQRSGAATVERALVDIRARVEHLEQRIRDASSTTPTLPAGDRCLACGSARLIGRADLSIKTNSVKADVVATVESRPASVFSTFTARSPVWAVVCGDCGRAELHLESTKSLLEAWQSRQKP